ncbi:MAG TPA: chorismate-binding protein [Planctomycetota bacterium]|nr:anthranilate synthase component I [Planctomycetota bacterium]MDP7246958.1 chorismate-binding protein [Planctomycetota bacterium]HJM38841.1 chorismate-binding protein [Planctomycetota bacterium]
MTGFLHSSTPSTAEAHHLAWLVLPADLHTPVRLFLSLRAANHQLCLLESAEGPDRIARWSFLGVDPIARFVGHRGGAVLTTEAGEEDVPGTPHEALQAVVNRFALPSPPAPLPPFCGGWVGMMSYEWATALEPTISPAAHDPWAIPMADFHLYRTVVGMDHATQKVVLIAACPGGASGHEAAIEGLHQLAHEIGQEPGPGQRFRLAQGEPRCSMTREQYEAGVTSLKESITQGDIFQAVLAQRFEQDFEGEPFSLYRALRLTNPSPHMFFFESDGLTLIGSSPERLVAVRGGRVQNRPIAGTRARSDDPDEDDRLGAELMGDRKERAEHDMLVDLARNDLGRIARTGTVSVKEHAVLEKFARVQHLVSRVECDLAANQTPLQALAASFPAGTVSGAPKVRAMQLLSDIEPDTRGPYAGAFGYLDSSGNLDMAISIRTFAVRAGMASLQAGAGVVFDSKPEREYAETLEKAQALFEALRLAGTGLFGGEEASS